MFILRRKNCWCLGVIIFLIAIFSVCVSAVRINEVMPHTNNSLGNEWVELYNEEGNNISLINWTIGDLVSNDIINLNISANGFAIITNDAIGCSNFSVPNGSCIELTTIGGGLNNVDETIYLYDNNSILISNLSWSENIQASGNSWQFYNETWQTCSPTPGQINLCEAEEPPVDEEPEDAGIYLELEWDEDEIINGEEFDIKVYAYNLEDDEDYDIKVWIEFEDNDTIISERYDEDGEEWKSGNYYFNEFISNEINETKDIALRIKDDYSHYTGDASIFVRLEESDGGKTVWDDDEYSIEILEGEEVKGEEDDADEDVAEDEPDVEETITAAPSGVISLNGAKDIKSEENSENKVYRSKTQYIKEYAIYIFALFCIGVIILLIIKR